MATVPLNYTADGNLIPLNWVDTTAVYNLGDIAWILTATALVMIMIPGVGFFYSGLLRRKNALSMIYMSLAVMSVANFQWFFWGWSLAFSETGSAYIGNLKYFALRNVNEAPSIGTTRLPANLYMVYQGMFAGITSVLAMGGFAERGRLGPMLAFAFCWLTVVYCPIACWTWNANGWSFVMGGLDFAGGSPVHISSGTASLAIALYLGKRRGYGTERLAYKPHSVSHVILGTVLLWFGWFGFNGGSAGSANLRAVNAMVVTNISASVGGLTWLVLDYRLERKWSAVGLCSGAVVGLVGITPAAGYVQPSAAVAIGFLTAVCTNFATRLKFLLNVDEALDVFATHAVGGVVGNVLTALFAQASVAALDGTTAIPGGWIDRHWVQLGYQLADSVAAMAYSLGMTTVLCWLFHFVPFMRLRASTDESEIIGLDESELGEFAYDFVALDPEARLVHHESPAVSSTATRLGEAERKASV